MSQIIRWADSGKVLYDDAGNIRGLTECSIRFSPDDAIAIRDYVKRFGLKNRPIDEIFSQIFEMGLREMKMQTDLDRYTEQLDVSE